MQPESLTQTSALKSDALFAKVTAQECKENGEFLIPSWIAAVIALSSLVFLFVRDALWLVIVLLILALTLWAVSLTTQQRVRLKNFAKANGLIYISGDKNFSHNGFIFNRGHLRRVASAFEQRDAQGRLLFEFGTYQYSEGSGRNRRTYNWKYVCMGLERNIPHMILDSRSNNLNLFGASLSNTGLGFSKEQVITLEGNFNEYFTLYGPPAYQVDARYVFTPDLMQLLIQNASKFDAEIIDNRIYFYQQGAMPMASKSLVKYIEGIYKLKDALLPKLDKQTQYYADDRVMNARVTNMVDESGRRLRTKTPILAILFVIFFVLFFIAGLIFG